jgi:LuxR family transcriptional regulator, maltose regulon positive regulatory protein
LWRFAPAGAGKTSLLSRLPTALPGADVAWLALDTDDDAPAVLLTGVAGALASLAPGCDAAVESALAAPGAEPRRAVGVLVNALLAARMTDGRARVLVLDDAHVLTTLAALEVLTLLLERLPPGHHVVLAARHAPPLPLARLRAQGQLAELTQEDLRFTAEEAEGFLNGRLDLGLAPVHVRALEARTGGWAAALRLLAAGLARLPSAEARAEALAHARAAADGPSGAPTPPAPGRAWAERTGCTRCSRTSCGTG